MSLGAFIPSSFLEPLIYKQTFELCLFAKMSPMSDLRALFLPFSLSHRPHLVLLFFIATDTYLHSLATMTLCISVSSLLPSVSRRPVHQEPLLGPGSVARSTTIPPSKEDTTSDSFSALPALSVSQLLCYYLSCAHKLTVARRAEVHLSPCFQATAIHPPAFTARVSKRP